ncbi:MAG: cation diffusion facilitator family transporter [Flavobacteriaceae bacterium]|nr:cation diffusion facilitator family transporter [Flavobacteriaceae bacterium]
MDFLGQSRFVFQRNIAIIGVFLFLGKLLAWYLTNSDAVYSDAMESVVNVVSAFMGLYSLYLAAKPKDKDHPYGHGKIEFITSGIEGVMIIFAGLMIIIEAVKNLLNNNQLQDLDWGIGIILLVGLINYYIGYLSVKKGERDNSLVLVASGKHLQSDTYTTFGVLLSLILVYFTHWYWLDGVVALGFGAYIIFVGYKIISEAFGGIMDKADVEILTQIVDVLEKHRKPEWVDIHNMKVQQFGSQLHIDAHITLPWYKSLKESHEEMEKIMHILAENTERQIEFNFHMDDCKPFSCSLCELDCVHRRKPFMLKMKWDTQSISQTYKHSLNK